MGILLPPVSQVTNTRINMTQHHRNRSLDSALQRIPEVISCKLKKDFYANFFLALIKEFFHDAIANFTDVLKQTLLFFFSRVF